MNLIGKKFKAKNGKILEVARLEGNNKAMFNDGSGVDIHYLLNEKYFTEITQLLPNPDNPLKQNINNSMNDIIDPNDFLNRSSTAFLSAAQNITNEQLSKMGDMPASPTPTVNYYDPNNSYNQNINVPIYQEDPELQKAELARKYNIQNYEEDKNIQLSRQAEYLKAIEEGRDPNVSIETTNQPRHFQENENYYQQPNATVTIDDPIILMFKKAKRNTDLSIDFKFETKIPRIDFIEMMEDSYEISIIEFLANEFTNEILTNPEFLKNKIKENIKNMLSSDDIEETLPEMKKSNRKKTVPNKTEKVSEEINIKEEEKKEKEEND